MVQKRLWGIRHGESMHNVQHQFKETHKKEEDFANTRLTEHGKKQAAKVHGSVDLLIVSPLRRTMETYAHSGLKVGRLMSSDLIREWRQYGPAGDFEHEKPAKESVSDLQKRVAQAIQLVKAQPETNITLLSHGVFLAEFAKAIGKPFNHGLANCQVIAFGLVDL